MKPRVAYILKMYPRFSETFIVNEILELERRGLDVRIYSLRKPDDGRFHASLARVKANVVYVPQYPEMQPERIQSAHLRLQAVRPKSYRRVHASVKSKGHRYAIKRFLQAGYIANHLLQHPVDALHAHFATSATRVANLVHQLTGLPYSFTAHAKDIFHEDVNASSLVDKMKAARFVVTVSDYNRNYLLDKLDGEPADVRRLYNGIDLKRFKPDPAVPRRENMILAVGRLVEKKGFHVLVRACALLRDRGISFRCRIIGRGGEADRLKALVSAFHLEAYVDLAGALPQDAVRRAYQEASIFALPCVVGSDNNKDGLPTVLLEAMATGLPVVTTWLTGNPEIVDQGLTGFLVDPDDPVALADHLQKLLQDRELREQFGRRARIKCRAEFDVRRNAGQLFNWLVEDTNHVVEEEAAIIDEIQMVSSLAAPTTLDAIFAAL